MRIVFAGTPEPALPALEACLASRHEVAAVVSRPPAPRGRGRTLEPSPVAERAAAAGIEVLTPDSPAEAGFVDRLRAIGPDCCPVVAYGALLRPAALAVPTQGWVNLHFSVLPAWRGAAPVHHAVMAGDEITGATVFRLVEELDAGPVFGAITEPIAADDTAGALLDRLSVAGARLLTDVLDHLEDDDIVAVPQPGDGVSYAPKVTTGDARVDWTRPAIVVDRRIRGCTPAPGAWTTIAGARLRLGPVRIADTDALAPGLAAVGKREVRVGTATRDIVLGSVQPPGKPMMPAADWGRGSGAEADGRVLGADE